MDPIRWILDLKLDMSKKSYVCLSIGRRISCRGEHDPGTGPGDYRPQRHPVLPPPPHPWAPQVATEIAARGKHEIQKRGHRPHRHPTGPRRDQAVLIPDLITI